VFFFVVNLLILYLAKIVGLGLLGPVLKVDTIYSLIFASLVNVALVFIILPVFSIINEIFKKKSAERGLSF
ncbi:hypothetical protein KKC60_04070, partial [Patescibacteria group bacterium]|nr:hypothetical protein [Patescibacteria group bacterium]